MVEKDCTRKGTLKAFMKAVAGSKEKGLTGELTDVMITHLNRYVEKHILAACDVAEGKGRKGITVEYLKAAMERNGVEL